MQNINLGYIWWFLVFDLLFSVLRLYADVLEPFVGSGVEDRTNKVLQNVGQ